MTLDIERIKFELLAAYDRDGHLDIADWTQRFPEHREELLDFWLWARRAAGEPGEQPPPSQPRISRLREEALQRACLSISLGPQWLRPLAAECDLQNVAAQIRRIRAGSPSDTPPSRRAFRRAVVCAWVVEELAGVRERVTRLAVQKTTYVLEKALHLKLFESHERKDLGPYDRTARYKDAEPIAVKKGWIRVSGSTLALGDAADFRRYAPRYLRSIEVARSLTRLLGMLDEGQLEVWATVLWVVTEHLSKDVHVDAATIRNSLKHDKQWSPKLQRPNFTNDHIFDALQSLRALGIISGV